MVLGGVPGRCLRGALRGFIGMSFGWHCASACRGLLRPWGLSSVLPGRSSSARRPSENWGQPEAPLKRCRGT
eukprot:13384936-Alexandrium_andersonii.AAC.1